MAYRWTYLTRKRIRAGYKQTQLAVAVNIHFTHINKIEAGTRGASPELCQRLAEVLGVDIDELLASAPRPPSQVTATPKPAEVAS